MEDVFKLISVEEDAEFLLDNRKYAGGRGSNVHVSVYELKINYKNHLIFVRNELGNSNLGKIHCELKEFSIPIFEITNRSHFWRLFNRKSNILKIACENQVFSSQLQQILLDTKLEKIGQDNLFEPKIYNADDNGIMNLFCDYHLEFEDKEGALRALINFYKSLIDYSLVHSYEKLVP